ncbi:MAG: HlyC/CorC family transporter [Flavobacteriales bacterium]|nr:HlyC/CorC family transporter [Flavobacteriales bacterium]
MTPLFLYLFLALSISFICSIMEAVLLSTTLSYLRVKEESGSSAAKIFIDLKQNIDRPLSAILSLNTIAHTVGAAGVGAQATKVFGEVYFGVVSATLTFLILVLSEIIPKSLGARYWRELAMLSGHAIRITIYITYPLVIIFPYITRLLSKKQDEPTVSKEELSALANIGAEEGIFGEKENKIIQNVIRLKGIRVSEIMTPRVVVAVADENMTLKDFLKNKEFLHFSRIPIYSENPEKITGYVFRQTVFEKLAEDQVGFKLKDIRRDIVIVPNTNPLFSVWEMLLEKKEHIALIVDEYGGVDGIATMEDIIETLVGFEIVDEKDTITDMRQYARERWKIKRVKYNLLNQFKEEDE